MTTALAANPETLCPICGGQNRCAVSQAKACTGSIAGLSEGLSAEASEDSPDGYTSTNGIECWCMHRDFPQALKTLSPEASRCICARCVDRYKADVLRPSIP